MSRTAEEERSDVLTWLEGYAAVIGGDGGHAVLAAAEIILQGKHKGLTMAVASKEKM